MKLYLALSFLCLVAASLAYDCPENICDELKCPNLDDCESRNGVVRGKAGVCGCCDHCVIQQKEGDHCVVEDVYGEAPDYECGEGLYCDEVTKICTRQDPADM